MALTYRAPVAYRNFYTYRGLLPPTSDNRYVVRKIELRATVTMPARNFTVYAS